MTRITDIAKVIRSKNCSPFELTLDIILQRHEDYERLKAAQAVTPATIAAAYRIPVEQIKDVVYFDPAKAIKITLRRQTPSGAPGDTDVYGAQQHGPLLNLEFDL